MKDPQLAGKYMHVAVHYCYKGLGAAAAHSSRFYFLTRTGQNNFPSAAAGLTIISSGAVRHYALYLLERLPTWEALSHTAQGKRSHTVNCLRVIIKFRAAAPIKE